MSDIRKIQTGNNQYTLHARVSDKLASVAKYKNASQNNYPWHRIATSGVLTTKVFDDKSVFLFLAEHYNDGRQGTIWISLRRNNTGNSQAVAKWISRSGFNIDDIQLGLNSTPGDTCLDIFVRAITPWTGGNVMMLSGGSRGADVDYYEFVNSSEDTNTTTTDKKTSVEVYKTIEEAATQLHGKAYTSIIKPTDSGTVANAGYAEKIGTNKSHPQIGSPTKPVYVDSSGQVKACTREIPNIPYSVTKIIPYKIGDFEYDAIYPYNKGPVTDAFIRVFHLEPGDKIIVHAIKSYNLELSFINTDFDESSELTVRVNTPIIVNDYRECVLRGMYHKDLPEGYVEIYRNNSTATDTFRLIFDELKSSKELANELYVNTFDGPFYRYKGSVDSLSNLESPQYLAIENAGDVYKIRTASTNNSITTNPGDYVVFVWDETKNAGHWDNLSGTVDLSNYLQKGGKQTTTSTADGGSNVYTFKDGSTITVKNGSKGSTGAAATWFSGGAVTGTSTTAKTFTVSGSKAGDMYLNTGTSNVYKATAANQWVYLCNIKGPQGTPGNNGTTPTIKAAAGGNINSVGTPSVTANTSGTTTTFTFNNLKGQKGDTGATVTWHTGTAVTGTAATVAGAKTGDMYLNTKTYNVYKSTGTNKWVGVCNIKGAKGDAADIPKLGPSTAGIVPGTRKIEDYPSNPKINSYLWLNGGENGKGQWLTLPVIGAGTSGQARACKDYTSNATNPAGYGHGSTPPTIQPLTSGANDYRGVECDKQGMLFVNVPAYEKNISRAQNTVLAAPTTGTGTATFRKLATSDIPWNEKFKVMTPAQYKTATKLTNVFYFILEE